MHKVPSLLSFPSKSAMSLSVPTLSLLHLNPHGQTLLTNVVLICFLAKWFLM